MTTDHSKPKERQGEETTLRIRVRPEHGRQVGRATLRAGTETSAVFRGAKGDNATTIHSSALTPRRGNNNTAQGQSGFGGHTGIRAAVGTRLPTPTVSYPADCPPGGPAARLVHDRLQQQPVRSEIRFQPFREQAGSRSRHCRQGRCGGPGDFQA